MPTNLPSFSDFANLVKSFKSSDDFKNLPKEIQDEINSVSGDIYRNLRKRTAIKEQQKQSIGALAEAEAEVERAGGYGGALSDLESKGEIGLIDRAGLGIIGAAGSVGRGATELLGTMPKLSGFLARSIGMEERGKQVSEVGKQIAESGGKAIPSAFAGSDVSAVGIGGRAVEGVGEMLPSLALFGGAGAAGKKVGSMAASRGLPLIAKFAPGASTIGAMTATSLPNISDLIEESTGEFKPGTALAVAGGTGAMTVAAFGVLLNRGVKPDAAAAKIVDMARKGTLSQILTVGKDGIAQGLKSGAAFAGTGTLSNLLLQVGVKPDELPSLTEAMKAGIQSAPTGFLMGAASGVINSAGIVNTVKEYGRATILDANVRSKILGALDGKGKNDLAGIMAALKKAEAEVKTDYEKSLVKNFMVDIKSKFDSGIYTRQRESSYQRLEQSAAPISQPQQDAQPSPEQLQGGALQLSQPGYISRAQKAAQVPPPPAVIPAGIAPELQDQILTEGIAAQEARPKLTELSQRLIKGKMNMEVAAKKAAELKSFEEARDIDYNRASAILSYALNPADEQSKQEAIAAFKEYPADLQSMVLDDYEREQPAAGLALNLRPETWQEKKARFKQEKQQIIESKAARTAKKKQARAEAMKLAESAAQQQARPIDAATLKPGKTPIKIVDKSGQVPTETRMKLSQPDDASRIEKKLTQEKPVTKSAYTVAPFQGGYRVLDPEGKQYSWHTSKATAEGKAGELNSGVTSEPVQTKQTISDKRPFILPEWLAEDESANRLLESTGKIIELNMDIGRGTVQKVLPPSKKYPYGSVIIKARDTFEGTKRIPGKQDQMDFAFVRDRIKGGKSRLLGKDGLPEEVIIQKVPDKAAPTYNERTSDYAKQVKAMPYAEDVNEELARRSHMGTSFSPERRAYNEIESYSNHLQNINDELQKYAKTDEQKAIAKEQFNYYRSKYKELFSSYLSAHSRVLSAMITGPARFPTRRNEKANNASDNRLKDMQEFRDKFLARAKRAIDPARNAISSDNPDAVEILQKKIDKAEKLQQTMVEANKIVRNKKLSTQQKIEQIEALPGIGKGAGKEILEPDFAGRIGFASYQLQNNNAEIKRLKDRVSSITKKRADETSETKFEGGKIIDNVEDNRLQIFFDEKPSAEIISKLKSRGFRWSPKSGVWQRMRGNDANYAAQNITGAAIVKKAPPKRIDAKLYSGEAIETGKPIVLTYLHNTEKSPNLGKRFQQDIEPAGKYIIEKHPSVSTQAGWESGTVKFNNPLVINFNSQNSLAYDENSWKAKLSKKYGKVGKALSVAITEDGYDGIITFLNGETQEIIDLTSLKKHAVEQPQELIPGKTNKSNLILMEAIDKDDQPIGTFYLKYDGSEADAKAKAEQLRNYLNDSYNDLSNINSRTISTDESGRGKFAISPNGKVSKAGTDAAAYTLGDLSKAPKQTEQPAKQSEALKTSIGKIDEAHAPSGKKLKVRYAAIPASSLITSETESFPQSLQPRNRTKIDSINQIESIAANPIVGKLITDFPGADVGTPIVINLEGKNIVLSGNGRVKGMIKGYQNGTMIWYQAALEDQAGKFGISSIPKNNPVLVRVLEGKYNLESLAKLAIDLNAEDKLSMSAGEKSYSDATAILKFASMVNSNDLYSAANREFVTRFFGEVTNKNDSGRFFDESGRNISKDGKDRIERAIFAAAYGTGRINEMFAEDAEPNIKNILNAMLNVGSQTALINSKSQRNELFNLSIGSAISEAAGLFSSLRKQGQTVEGYFAQGQLFDDGISALAKDILIQLDKYKTSAKKLTELFSLYNNAIIKLGDPRQKNLTNEIGTIPTRSEVLNESIERMKNKYEEKQPDLFTNQNVGMSKSEKGSLYSIEYLAADYAAKGLKQAAQTLRAGVNFIRAGIKTFAQWARKMSAQFGRTIHKFLRSMFNDLKAVLASRRGAIKTSLGGKPGLQKSMVVNPSRNAPTYNVSGAVYDDANPAFIAPISAPSMISLRQEHIARSVLLARENPGRYAAGVERHYERIREENARFKEQQIEAYTKAAEENNTWYGWANNKRGGINPAIARDGMKMLLDGAVKFADWSKAMLKKYGNLAGDSMRRLFAKLNQFLKLDRVGGIGGRKKAIKTIIAEQTGMKKPEQIKELSDKAALKRGLSREASAAKKAFSAGIKETKIRVEKALKSKYANIEDSRNILKDFAMKALLPSDRSAALQATLNAKTPAQFTKIADRILEAAESRYRKNELERFRKLYKQTNKLHKALIADRADLLGGLTDSEIESLVKSNAFTESSLKKLRLAAENIKSVLRQYGGKTDLNVPDFLLDGFKEIADDFGPAELNTVNDGLAYIDSVQNLINKATIKGQIMDASMAASKITKELPEAKLPQTRETTRAGFVRSYLKPVTAINSMDGLNLAASMGESGKDVFYSQLNEGQDKSFKVLSDGFKFKENLEKSLGGDNWLEYLAKPSIDITALDGQQFKLSNGEKLYVVALAEDPQTAPLIDSSGFVFGDKADSAPFKIPLEKIEELRDNLTPAERVYINELRRHINTDLLEKTNETNQNLEGYILVEGNNQYFPRARQMKERSFSGDKKADMLEGYQDMLTTAEYMPFLKNRVPTGNIPFKVRSIDKVFDKQLQETALHYGMAEPLRNISRIMNMPGFERKVTRTFGIEFVERLKQRSALIAMQSRHDTSIDKTLMQLLRQAAPAKLTPRSFLKQFSSVPAASTVIPWAYLGKAIADKSTLRGATFERMKENSPLAYLRYRNNAAGIFVPGVFSWEDQNKVMRGLKGFQQNMLSIPARFDGYSLQVIYRAAELWAQAENQPIEWAASQFEKAVKETQNTMDVVHATGWQEQARQNIGPALLGMFKAQPMKGTQNTFRSWTAWREGRISFARFVSDYLSVVLGNSGANTAVILAVGALLGKALTLKDSANILLDETISTVITNPLANTLIDVKDYKRAVEGEPINKKELLLLGDIATIFYAIPKFIGEMASEKEGHGFFKALKSREFEKGMRSALHLGGIPTWPVDFLLTSIKNNEIPLKDVKKTAKKIRQRSRRPTRPTRPRR